MKQFLAIGIVLFLSSLSFAKEKAANVESVKENSESTMNSYSIKGTVLDRNNNETLAGASILIDGKKYYSDLDGNFVLPNISEGKHLVTVNFISYESQSLMVDTKEATNIEVELQQK